MALNEFLLLLWGTLLLVGLMFILEETVLQPLRNKKIQKELLSILKNNSIDLMTVKSLFLTRVGTIRYIDEIFRKIRKDILLDPKSEEEIKTKINDLIMALEKEKKFHKLPIDIQTDFQALEKEFPNNITLSVILEKLPRLLKEKDSMFKKIFKFLTIIFSLLGLVSSIITINSQFKIIEKFGKFFS